MSEKRETVRSRIWQEIGEHDNPFAAAACYCSGYDVYGELLHRGSWVEYLFLLFAGERPTKSQAKLLDGLAIALANPGPRDPSVTAAMNGGVGGSTSASCLMAALAAGAGQMSGAHEVALAMEHWNACGADLSLWHERLQNPVHEEREDIWLPMQHPAGFDPHGASCAKPVRQTLAYLASVTANGKLGWLQQVRKELERIADCPLAMSGVAAAALVDLGFRSPQGEMLYLLLRLPGAAVHALERMDYGWRNYPFFADALELLETRHIQHPR